MADAVVNRMNQIDSDIANLLREKHSLMARKQIDALAEALLENDDVCSVLSELTPQQAALFAGPIAANFAKMGEMLKPQFEQMNQEAEARRQKAKERADKAKASKERKRQAALQQAPPVRHNQQMGNPVQNQVPVDSFDPDMLPNQQMTQVPVQPNMGLSPANQMM